MADNAQQQADEIEALQCIYAEDVVVTSEATIEININVAISTPFSVISPSPSAASAASSSEVPPEALGEAYPIISLPPITLQATYHPAYPSEEPPMFVLSCTWLSGPQLSALCKRLDDIWSECVGEVVLFRWVSWIMEETASFLGITSPYVLPIFPLSEEEENQLDSRADSACDRFCIGYIIDHDKQARRDLFGKSEHTCGICYMDYPGPSFIHQITCEHAFCRDCMKQMCQINIKAGTIADLKCPDKNCKKQVLPQVVRELVSDELLERYERLLLDRSLHTMEDVMWCPHCSTPVIIDEKLTLGACTKCSFSFCTICLQSWHPGRECSNANKIAESMKQRSSNLKKEALMKLNQEIDSMVWMLDHAKMCPKCKTPIEKTEGCNKMTCSKCGSYFCWNCRQSIGGYDHFGGKCKLFSDIPLYYPDGQVAPVNNNQGNIYLNVAQRRQIAHQQRVMRQQMLVERAPGKAKRCPRCNAHSAKENNNNHIACWNCPTQWCFLCHQVIFGTAHFNKGKCKHHTADD